MKERNPAFAGCLAMFGTITLFAVSACSEPTNGAAGRSMPPPSVTLSAVELDAVEVFGDFTGRIHGAREVEVRAQVGGILEQRLFIEGENVNAGTPLFQIERVPYEIALRRAEAELADGRANLNQAEREWRRASTLFSRNAISERERDRALSQFELAQARVAMAEAGVDEARLNLGYTAVQAPIAGASGLETLSEGNLIERGTLLTTVTQLDPIHVIFALPQNDRAARQAIDRAKAAARANTPLDATMLLPDGGVFVQTGVVDFIGSTVDPRTGTVNARAVFANPDEHLRPGQFVRVRLLLEVIEKAARIPAEAVVQGPEGPSVFVVDSEAVAHRRTVELGPVIDGRQVVTGGLAAGNRLVVNGQVALRGGETVQVSDNGQGAR